jgi:hypothetical protein
MKKKTALITSGACGLILAIGACTGSNYAYEVSGSIEARQIDYDCPGEDTALDPVAFIAGKGGGGKSKSKSSSGKKKAEAPKVSPGKTTSSTSRPKTSSGSRKGPLKNRGVSLNEKPDKPEKIKGKTAPKPKYKIKPKGCKEEYEIFVLSDGDLYEQDVRKVDYDRCLTAKGQSRFLFPLCTKG